MPVTTFYYPQAPDSSHQTVSDSLPKKKSKKEKKKKEKKKTETEESQPSPNKDSLVIVVPPLKDTVASTSQIPEKSIFKDHLLQTHTLEPQLNIRNTQHWISWLLLACFATIVWLQSTNRKKLFQLFQAFLSSRAVKQLVREEYALGNRLSISLSALFLIVSSIFIYQIDSHFEWFSVANNIPIVVFLKIAGILFSFYLIKILLIRIAGIIFNSEQEAFEHIFNIFLFNEVMSIIIFPLVICIQFADEVFAAYLIYTVLFLVGGAYLYKFLRILLTVAVNKRISKFYLFLYLCVLEILPLVVIMKLFMSRI